MNLIEGLIEEMNRVREIIKIYEEKPAGNFAAAIMKVDIANAEKAMANGDVIAELQCFEVLKSYEL